MKTPITQITPMKELPMNPADQAVEVRASWKALTKEDVEFLYFELDRSTQEIASMYSVSVGTVDGKLRKFSIRRKDFKPRQYEGGQVENIFNY